VWQSFIGTVLEPPPSALSVLAMIRLNDAIYRHLVTDALCPAAEMESYLIGVRLQLWPLFNRDLNAQLEAVRKLTAAATGSSGLFGAKASSVKDAMVQKVRS
jgi:hypothetical protein